MTASYLMIGGFLGAGKTTAIAAIAQRLADRGLRAGLITNDQSQGLVDTAILRSRGFAVEEITGGCFCCRFDSLRAAADGLAAASAPDVFVAEPVGSCTDLVATVAYPLRRLYGDAFRVAPLSVVVDPTRLGRMLGILPGPRFSPKVAYVFFKQLEEAELIVLNKIDAVDAGLLDALSAAIAERFPATDVLPVSARTGAGVDGWLDRLLAEEAGRRAPMALDYGTYAEGEALLGWYNATARAAADAAFDASDLLVALAGAIRDAVPGAIAHIKLSLDPGLPGGPIASVSAVDDRGAVERRDVLPQPVDGGALMINLRAEAAPEALSAAVAAALAGSAVPLTLEHADAFRPSPPRPTHRDDREAA